MRHGPEWFQGTADAVYQNIHLIESMQPDIVAVFGADHIYRMDVRQMIDFHIQSNAAASVATLPVRPARVRPVRHRRHRRQPPHRRLQGKAAVCDPMPGSRTHALASMGNYIFNADVLLSS
jgi:glucose-1-phosphate adenylyltransferase